VPWRASDSSSRPYPKDKEYRLKLSPQIMAKLKVHIEARGLGPDALLFVRRVAPPISLRIAAEPDAAGFTDRRPRRSA